MGGVPTQHEHSPIDAPLRTDDAGWASVAEPFARHVHPGRVAVMESLGVHLVMGAREGARFQDAVSGRWLWNCHSNGGVFNLGHRNPRIIAALREALDTIDIGNHHLVSPHRARAAQRLAATTGDRLPGVVFATTGSEAVEIAIKAARGFTGRRRVITVIGGFHGHTGLAIAAGDAATKRRYLLDFADFVQIPFDDLDAAAEVIDAETAAVLVEPIPATLGFPMPSPGYLAGVERLCRQNGALMIVDEVQTGLGRTGEIWAHEAEDIRPDVLITGKGLGGGVYPVSAALFNDEIFAWFTEEFTSHVSSFAGSELGCVVASTVCEMIEEPGFLTHVRDLTDRFTAALADAPFRLRQRGLVMGIDLGDDGAALPAWRRLYDAGVFAFPAGFDTAVLQFKPPLVLGLDEAEEIAGIVRAVLG